MDAEIIYYLATERSLIDALNSYTALTAIICAVFHRRGTEYKIKK